MTSANVQKFVDELSKLTVMEAAELAKALKETGAYLMLLLL